MSKYVQQPEGADAGVLAGVAVGALVVLILLAIIVALFVIKKRYVWIYCAVEYTSHSSII